MIKRILPVLALAGTIAVCSLSYAYERINPRGPMAIRNQMPLYLFWYAFPQDRAQVAGEKKLVTSLDYTVSNVVVDKVTTPTEEYVIRADMEVNRINLDLRYGALEQLELELEVPYLILSSGYLDTFVEHFESSVGATPVGARSRGEKYKFNYNVRHNDVNLINTQDPPSGLGDVAFSAKYMLLDETASLPRISVRGAVKFPTASKSKYLGSGKFDAGAGVLMDKQLLDRLIGYLNLNTVFINKPGFLDEMDIKGYILTGMAALEYCFTERFSAVLQGTLHSTPYPKTGTDPLDNNAGEAALGLNYQLTVNSNWHIAVVENLFADSTPDVTFQAGGRIKF